MNEKGDVFIPDILPCDTRYLLYDTDEDGLVWAAYKTMRSITQIKARYPNLLQVIPQPGSDITHLQVTDLWDRESEKVYIGSLDATMGTAQAKEVWSESNRWGYVPFVIEICPIGPSGSIPLFLPPTPSQTDSLIRRCARCAHQLNLVRKIGLEVGGI